jgi:hypothetical protein
MGEARGEDRSAGVKLKAEQRVSMDAARAAARQRERNADMLPGVREKRGL